MRICNLINSESQILILTSAELQIRRSWENGGVIHLRWKNPGHADNVRFVKLYKNAGKNVIIFRNSSFNMRMDPVNVKFNKDPHKLVNAFIINR